MKPVPHSIPTVLPQPDTIQYPLTELSLFPRLTRAAYFQLYGEQAPAWDKTRRIQRWFDSSAGTLPPKEPYYVYHYVRGANGLPVLSHTVITNAEAAVPNLPGVFRWPKHVTAPSGAWQPVLDENGIATGEKRYLLPDALSHHGDALALRTELQRVEGIGEIPEPYESVLGGPFAVRFDDTERRRFWNFIIRGESMSVGLLLRARYVHGVGAPGRWDLISDHYLRWIPDVPTDAGEQDLRPEIPIPQRALYLNERFIIGTPFSGPMVERTDTTEAHAQADVIAMPRRVSEILQRLIELQRSFDQRQ